MESMPAENKIVLTNGAAGKNLLKAINVYTGNDGTTESFTSKEGLNQSISNMQSLLDTVLGVQSDLGARMNRAELTLNRLGSDELNFTKMMSENEDVDMAEVIMNLQNEENVYRSSLSVGARVIMPTLMDFLR
jgi:flagellin-like hook-associated protein FlgL